MSDDRNDRTGDGIERYYNRPNADRDRRRDLEQVIASERRRSGRSGSGKDGGSDVVPTMEERIYAACEQLRKSGLSVNFPMINASGLVTGIPSFLVRSYLDHYLQGNWKHRIEMGRSMPNHPAGLQKPSLPSAPQQRAHDDPVPNVSPAASPEVAPFADPDAEPATARQGRVPVATPDALRDDDWLGDLFLAESPFDGAQTEAADVALDGSVPDDAVPTAEKPEVATTCDRISQDLQVLEPSLAPSASPFCQPVDRPTTGRFAQRIDRLSIPPMPPRTLSRRAGGGAETLYIARRTPLSGGMIDRSKV